MISPHYLAHTPLLWLIYPCPALGKSLVLHVSWILLSEFSQNCSHKWLLLSCSHFLPHYPRWCCQHSLPTGLLLLIFPHIPYSPHYLFHSQSWYTSPFDACATDLVCGMAWKALKSEAPVLINKPSSLGKSETHKMTCKIFLDCMLTNAGKTKSDVRQDIINIRNEKWTRYKLYIDKNQKTCLFHFYL